MSDKEPRRRKKRKDSQPPRKEDVHATDDHFFMPPKSETKDSDQELEEEIVIPTHQPSVFAKFVFVLLFSGLVVSLSFIFISLHGTDRGEVDVFNGHTEEVEVPHDEHDFHGHDDNDHDHDEHDHDHDDNDHNHDDHDIDDHDEETSEESLLQGNLADYFPSIGSILSFKDEHSKEPAEESFSDDDEEGQLSDEQLSDLPVPSPTDEYISSTSQDSKENVAEDTEQSTETPVLSEMYPDTLEEPRSDISPDEVPSDQASKISPEHKPEVDEQDDEISENVVEYSDSSTYITKTESPDTVTESYTSAVVEDILPTTPAAEEIEYELYGQDDTYSADFIETPSVNTVEEEVTYYEKESITNDEDFKIREQLDDLDEIFQKEFSVDENDEGDDDDNDDDDDEYDDDEARDEFDFWQF